VTFQAYNSITASTVVINNSGTDGASVTLKAGQQISLEPGFDVKAGTASPAFHAVIGTVQ
jgi:hypothetical protein